MRSIRILIVEDELIVSEEIKEILISEGLEVVGQCRSADEALELIMEKPVDVALQGQLQ